MDLRRLPEDIELEIVSAYCGLRCPLAEALDRRREYASCLAELDFVRHNVQTGTTITQRIEGVGRASGRQEAR